MKKIIILSAFLFISLLAMTQPHDVVIYNNTLQFDSLNKVCAERGHVLGTEVERTLAYCEPYTVDTDSTTTLVYPACNYMVFTCVRCGNKVIRRGKERRVVIWRKENSKD